MKQTTMKRRRVWPVVLLFLCIVKVVDGRGLRAIQNVQISLGSSNWHRKLWQRQYKYEVVEVISSRDKACREIVDIYLLSQEMRLALEGKAAISTLTSLSARFLHKMTSLKTYLEFFTETRDALREPCPLPDNDNLTGNGICFDSVLVPGCLHCATYEVLLLLLPASDLDSGCSWLLRDFQDTQVYLKSLNTSLINRGSSTTIATSDSAEKLLSTNHELPEGKTTSTGDVSATFTASLGSTELQSSMRGTETKEPVSPATPLESASLLTTPTERSTSVINEHSASIHAVQTVSSSTSFPSLNQQSDLETGSSAPTVTSTLTEDTRSFNESTEGSLSTVTMTSNLSIIQSSSAPQSLRYITVSNCTSQSILPEHEARVQLSQLSKAYEHDLLVLKEGKVFLPDMRQMLRFLQTMWEPLSRKRRESRTVKRFALNFQSDQLQLSENTKCSLNKYDDPKYLTNLLEESTKSWGETLTDVDRLFYVACYLAKVTSVTNDETIEKGVLKRSRDASIEQQLQAILNSTSTYDGEIGSLQVRTEEARFNVTEGLENRSSVVHACV
ncbi:serine-rich adhesin for platelets-like [Macrobrachium rosenbergii]|uniref:serine-rich adhesin for platelets-like n=1 Tax=Macrobrachium rosenbergii TaxID=79674 RepID=UPI0034D43B17